MKICAAIQQKGGVGKTNCIVHLAHDASERGLKVLIIDLDTQANATYSMQQYKSSALSSDLFKKAVQIEASAGITLVAGDPGLADIETLDNNAAGEQFRNNLDALGEQFDLCLIDTAPALGVRMVCALYVADFVFSPVEAQLYSVLGISLMQKTIKNMKKINQKLDYIGLIPSRFNSRNALQVETLNTLRTNHPGLVAPVTIGERSSIGEALHYGIPVWAIKRTAARTAAKEIRTFTNYIFTRMELFK